MCSIQIVCVHVSVSHTDLSLRHDIDIVIVQREGHVSENGAPVLIDRHCLVLHTAIRRSIHTDLKQDKEVTHTYISKYQLAHNNTAG